MFLRKSAVFVITAYQLLLSPDRGFLRYCGLVKGEVCGLSPSCSEYAKEAILSRGVAVGVFLGAKRILSCHPFKLGIRN